MTTRQYSRFVFGTIFLLATVVAGFNVLVDSRGLFADGRFSHVFGFVPDYESRASRAELLHRGGWETVVIGTSRVHVGIDPRAPVFGDRPVLNLGLPNTSLCELRHVAERVAERSCISTVYWFVELELFDTGCVVARGIGASRFDPGFDLVEFTLENALGYRATLETLDRIRGVDSVWTDSTGAMHEARPVLDPERAASAILEAEEDRMSRFTLSDEKIELFDEIARTLLAAGKDLYVVYSPVHASMLEVQRINGLVDDEEHLLRTLMQRVEAAALEFPGSGVELWDFNGYRGEAIADLPASANRWTTFRDPSHFRPGLGARLIAAMRDGGRDPAHPDRLLGWRLTSRSIDAHLTTRRSERDGYVVQHAAETERPRAVGAHPSSPQ